MFSFFTLFFFFLDMGKNF